MPTPEPTHDTRRAATLRFLNPGFSYCFRCGTPWSNAISHVTSYGNRGCFPLCEKCWDYLGCGEARIEHYKTLVDWWVESGCEVSDDDKFGIMNAVANGR